MGQLVVMMVTLFSPFRSSPKASLRSCFLKHTYEERVGRSLPETASAKEPPLTFDYPNKTYRNAFFYLFLVADLDCKVFLDPEKKNLTVVNWKSCDSKVLRLMDNVIVSCDEKTSQPFDLMALFQSPMMASEMMADELK